MLTHIFDTSFDIGQSRRAFTIEQLCAYVRNIDGVRDLTMVKESSVDKLEATLFERHANKNREVQTPYMKARDKYYVGYKSHYYEADVIALAFDKASLDTGELDYAVYFNFSGSSTEAWPNLRSRDSHWNHLTAMANRMAVQKLTVGNRDLETVRMQGFPTEFKCNRDEWLNDDTGKVELDCPAMLGFLNFNIADFIAGIMMMFFFWVPVFGTVQVVVYEKQYRLRVIMRMMGLTADVYWLVTYALEVLKYTVNMTAIFIVGRMFGLKYFNLHDQGLLWIFMFVWANVITMFGFFLASLFKNTKTSGAVTFLLIMMFFTAGQDLTIFTTNLGGQSEDFAPLMWNPAIVMFRWSYAFAFQSFQGEYITAETYTEIQGGGLVETMELMILHWFIWAGLAAYCNVVLPTGGHGARAPFYFCLLPKWWKQTFLGASGKSCGGSSASIDLNVQNPASDDVLPPSLAQSGWHRPHDAEAEHQRVITAPMAAPGAAATGPNIRVINLHKQFPSKGGAPPKVAVRCVSMGVNHGECFGLLGHNGAGKTTAINMLTGLFAPTSGTAYVGPYSIRDNISDIYADMGVCPQHDLLWPALTAREHMSFYGRLKGFSGNKLKQMVKEMLVKVNLTDFAKRKAGGFSGGMKRRLSMANALMGGPSVVYMDEPSTGLDPASKHSLWDVIANAKKVGNRSMVLTTHSMEEADVLCDRLCIMADGEIQCIGRTHELKRRFGRGYTLMIKIPESQGAAGLAQVDAFVKRLFPTAALLNEPIAGCSKYEIDRREVVLSKVFAEMIQAKSQLGMEAWSFTESTLEEVFLKLAALTECFSGGSGLPAGKTNSNVVPLAQDSFLADMVAKMDAEAAGGGGGGSGAGAQKVGAAAAAE